LRLYEQRGLLTPLRSEAGWRTYGPDQIARLHQILALKRLGLPLAKIGELLAGPHALETVLAVQEQVLARTANICHAPWRWSAPHGQAKAGQALSIDDLATLNQETVMTRIVGAKEMKQLFAPLAIAISARKKGNCETEAYRPDQSKRDCRRADRRGEGVDAGW